MPAGAPRQRTDSRYLEQTSFGLSIGSPLPQNLPTLQCWVQRKGLIWGGPCAAPSHTLCNRNVYWPNEIVAEELSAFRSLAQDYESIVADPQFVDSAGDKLTIRNFIVCS